jgi:hypothetical protein
MGKRRTKKQKIKPHRSFLLSWSNEPKKEVSKAGVKRQFKKRAEASKDESSHVKNAKKLAKEGSFDSVKRDILTSLILASFILGLEVVIYLAWNVK